MSDLIVEVSQIRKISPHPNADNLEIAFIKGFEIIVNKNSKYQVGDKVVYFPVDTVFPRELAERFGIWKYLKPLDKNDLNYDKVGRLYAANLRGIPSYGHIERLEIDFPLGHNLRDYYGVWKWEPPTKFNNGQLVSDHSLFHKYTDIQNYKHFPGVFREGDEIIISEKIHGTNSRVGWVKDSDNIKKFMCGTHYNTIKENTDSKKESLYTIPLKDPFIINLLNDPQFEYANSVILFGEIYGRIADLKYGIPNKLKYAAFDITINGKYLDFDAFKLLCMKYSVPIVPILYIGKNLPNLIPSITSGKTKVGEDKDQIREGIIIKGIKEDTSKELFKYNNGRKILKNHSDEFMLRKGKKTEDH